MNTLLHIKNKKYYNTRRVKLKHIKKTPSIHYGDWGIVTMKEGVISPDQLETLRCILSKNIKHIGKLWIKILPDHPITQRPKDSRMGSGKGKIVKWVYVLRPGEVIFEATEISKTILIPVFKLIQSKVPLKLQIIYKNDIYSY